MTISARSCDVIARIGGRPRARFLVAFWSSRAHQPRYSGDYHKHAMLEQMSGNFFRTPFGYDTRRNVDR